MGLGSPARMCMLSDCLSRGDRKIRIGRYTTVTPIENIGKFRLDTGKIWYILVTMDTEAHIPDHYAPIPDEPGMPEAYAKISPKQRAWLQAFLDAGDENATAAARRAGYGSESGTPAQAAQACKTAGHRNVHDEDIQAAIRELAHERFRVAGYQAAAALMALVKDTSHKDHFKAIERVLAQNGMIAAVQIDHNHKHTVTEKDQIERVVALARRLGMDPRTLLGSAGVDYVDAEFTEVLPLTALPEPAMSAAGLEDLL